MLQCKKCNKKFERNLQFCPVCGYEDSTFKKEKEFTQCPICKTEYSYLIDHCTCCGYSTESYKKNISNIYSENEQQRNISNQPHCPTCGSTNVRKISTTKKAGSILGFGILSSSLGKTYECLNPKCKYKW